MTAADAVESAYRTLAERATDRNRARASEVRALLDEWRRQGELTADQRGRARAAVHSLRGSAGTFGHESASLVAGELEAALTDSAVPLETAEILLGRVEASLCVGARVPGGSVRGQECAG